MDRATEERLSSIVIRAVDSLGYSDVCIRTRQAEWKELERRSLSNQDQQATVITAGRKAEGTSLSFESDTDMIGSLNNLVCSDNIRSINKAEYKAVFLMDTQNVPAGYTRLRHTDFEKARSMARWDETLTMVHEASLEYNGEYYLSSVLLYPPGHHRSGPASTVETIEHIVGLYRHKFSLDRVIAIPCQGESMLQDWIKRTRRHGWPSREVIQYISTLQGHVVPVGFKGSDDEFIQWRICYTPAEVALMHELNHIQAVLFVIMKMISKQILKPVCGDITSYIIKNIILWMAELLPRNNFTENNFMSVLVDCLKILRETVRRKYLANYMISTRNLFSGKLEHQDQQNLCELLSTMIEQGPGFLVQYPQLDRLRRRMQLVYLDPDAALFEQMCREGLQIDLYKNTRGMDMDISTMPCEHPLVIFCVKQGYPGELTAFLAKKLLLYLLGYYDSQQIA